MHLLRIAEWVIEDDDELEHTARLLAQRFRPADPGAQLVTAIVNPSTGCPAGRGGKDCKPSQIPGPPGRIDAFVVIDLVHDLGRR